MIPSWKREHHILRNQAHAKLRCPTMWMEPGLRLPFASTFTVLTVNKKRTVSNWSFVTPTSSATLCVGPSSSHQRLGYGSASNMPPSPGWPLDQTDVAPSEQWEKPATFRRKTFPPPETFFPTDQRYQTTYKTLIIKILKMTSNITDILQLFCDIQWLMMSNYIRFM